MQKIQIALALSFLLIVASASFATGATTAERDLASRTDQTLAAECFRVLRGFGLKSENVNGNLRDVSRTLACRMKDYLLHVRSLGCTVGKGTISSGYRSPQKQAQICGKNGKKSECAAPGRSCHQFAAAIDATGISKGNGCTAATGVVAAQYGLIFGYSSRAAVPADNRKNGKNHFQCIENRISGVSSGSYGCNKQVCGCPVNDPDCGIIPPPPYNPNEWDANQYSEDLGDQHIDTVYEQNPSLIDEPTTAPLEPAPQEQVPQGPITPEQLKDQQPTEPQDSGSIFNNADSIFAENESNIFCSDEFGSDQEGCEDAQIRDLLGEDLGLIESAGADNTEDEYAYIPDGDGVLNDAVQCPPGETPSLNNPGTCVSAGGQVVQAEGGASITNTIRNAPSISEGVAYLLTGRSSDIGELFAWGSQETAPNRYLSVQFHSPQDGPYFASRYGQAYYSDGVPDNTIVSFAASNDPQYTQTSGFSFERFFSNISFSVPNAVSTQFGLPYLGPSINAFNAWWR